MRKYHYTMWPLFDRSSYIFLFCLFVGIFSLQISAQTLDGAIHDVTAPLEILRSFTRPKTNYSGILHMKYTVKYERDFKLDSINEEMCLSWEEAWPSTGDRMDTFLHFRKKLNSTDRSTKSTNVTETSKKQRSKRRIFRNDNRVPISLRRYGHRFPFVSVVKLSTGCTGTLVSPQHVLTAAHCIHNQSDYVTGYKTLKVCMLPKSRFSRRFHCIKVNSTFLPMGWLVGNENIASRFDYALLKLEQKHTKPYFELDVFNIKRPWKIRPPILHFTAFEDDKPLNTLWYRRCPLQYMDDHVLYHHCDAQPGSSGAGVYTFTKFRKEWKRRLIGVFSGYRWEKFGSWKRARDFNAAIRMSSSKYLQICRWMGKYASKTCKRFKRQHD